MVLMVAESALRFFSPLIREWFGERLGAPTEVQEKAWPLIRSGRHVLATAPTGSGKTMAAFLWAIEQVLSGAWPSGAVRVLYVSPLRALGNDVQRNLLTPLAELQALADKRGQIIPEIRVLTRSGDTSPAERRRMIRQPPEILITTPESLNILVSSVSGRQMLRGVATVILDEIHAVASSKRGTLLMAGVERLTLLAGEFQRVALSATARPLEIPAAFIGGSSLIEGGVHQRRDVESIAVEQPRPIEVDVSFPTDLHGGIHGEAWWSELARTIVRDIRRHRTTLVFTRGRRGAEKVARFVNEEAGEPLAFAHHGSLSREIRLLVEERMKRGELPAIVATTSLELGIDIGSLEQVIMVQTPFSAASALQRIGRAGHHVGGVSRAVIYPSHGRDLLDAAVLARCVLEGDIEALETVRAPLDVLAQIIVAMVSVERWSVGCLFDFLRCIDAYSDLQREDFDRVVEMLLGRHAGRRLRDIIPRIRRERVDGADEDLLEGRPGSLRSVYMAGGTIPDRGYFSLRVSGSDVRIGEADEEFVWERTLGETFTLGTQAWRIEKITHDEVEVSPVERTGAMIPFWRSEDRGRGAHLAERTADFLEWADQHLDEDEFQETLIAHHAFRRDSAEALSDFLRSQRAASAAALPHRHHLLIEECHDAVSTGDTIQIVLHTYWGARANRPFALALEAAARRRDGLSLQTTVDDECILVLAPRHAKVESLIHEIRPENLAALLRESLPATGFFGARFRECAARALLLPRRGFKTRTPLWFNRRRAKQLLESVASLDSFPIVSETWRSSLQDEFEMEFLRARLEELERGVIKTSHVFTKIPSPFARQVVRQWTNSAMYDDDRPQRSTGATLTDDLVDEILSSSRLRPALPREIVDDFERRVRRLLPEYLPRSAESLYDELLERFTIPEDEWRDLCEALIAESGEEAAAWIAETDERSVRVIFPTAKISVVIAVDRVDEAESAANLHLVIEEYLRSCGPVALPRLLAIFGEGAEAALRRLEDDGVVMRDLLTEEAVDVEVCDRRNLEILLRRARIARRPSLEPLAAKRLPLFLAQHQGLIGGESDADALLDRLAQLAGYPARAEAWESDLLPARVWGYRSSWLDQALSERGLVWVGCGEKKLTFCFDDEVDLLAPASSAAHEKSNLLDELFPEGGGRFSLAELAQRSGRDVGRLSQEVWKAAWDGRVGSTGFAVVRQAIRHRFRTPGATDRERSGKESPSPYRRIEGRRRAFAKWRSSHPFQGDWYRVRSSGTSDALVESERSKERARQVLDRYGVVFRALLAREAKVAQWGSVFRALRLMELSGEIVAGYFFEGVSGLQFASHDAVRTLRRALPKDVVYWMSASDPASPCGLDLSDTGWRLPSRQGRVHLVFHDDAHVMTSKSSGRHLEIFVGETNEALPRYLNFFRGRLVGDGDAPMSIEVETINERPVHESPYAPFLRAFGFERTLKGLEIRRNS